MFRSDVARIHVNPKKDDQIVVDRNVVDRAKTKQKKTPPGLIDLDDNRIGNKEKWQDENA